MYSTFYLKPKLLRRQLARSKMRVVILFTKQYFPGPSPPQFFLKHLWLLPVTIDAQMLARLQCPLEVLLLVAWT